MKRIYYLLDNLEDTETISKALHENGIADWQFHVMAKNEEGLFRHHLHRANFFQKRDVVHSGEQGALIGGVSGVYLAFFILPWTITATTVLATVVVAFVIAGIVIGSVLGNTHENYKISRFHNDLEQGKLLVMLDIRKSQHATVLNIINQEFPELKSAGADSIFSNPLKKGAWIHI